jgi:hypothetical protein
VKEGKEKEYEEEQQGGRTGEEEEKRRLGGRTRTMEVRNTGGWRKNWTWRRIKRRRKN